MSDNLLRVQFQLQVGSQLARFIDANEWFKTIELDNAIYAGSGQWFEYLTLVASTADSPPDSTLATLPQVEVLDSKTAGTDPPVYYAVLFVDEVAEFILPMITRERAIPHRILLTDGRLRVVVTVHDWTHLKEFADSLEHTYDGFELVGTRQVDDIGFLLGGDKLKHTMQGKLTAEQLLALEVAYQMGYFQVPQEATGTDVAKRLESSQSAISERLRRAQQELFAVLFGPNN